MGTRDRRPLLLRPGDRLAGYEIDDVLGVGGMATVYEATQTSLRRRVALKVLDARLAEDDAFRERFRHEGAHLAALDHPSIVPVYDSGEADGRLYLAMRLVDGDTLADRMRDGVSADEVVAIVDQIAGALDAAHAEVILHRDVKPQNILLTGERAYLADFGVAKSTAAATMTGTGGFLGSVHYAAPEQIRGTALGPATDVYALAAVAYECLTGRPPFDRESEVGVIHGHLEEQPPELPGRGGRAVRDLSAVLTAGMAKDPAQRPASAGAFAHDLRRAVERLGNGDRSRRPAFVDQVAPRRRSGGTGSSEPTTGITFVADAAPGLAATADTGASRDDARAETVDLPHDDQVRHLTVSDRRTRFVPRAAGATERRSRAALYAGAALLLLAVAAAAGWALLRAPAETELTAGPFRLTVPGEVQVTRAESDIFGGMPATPGGQALAGDDRQVRVSLGSVAAGLTLKPAKASAPATVVATDALFAWSWPAGGSEQRSAYVLVVPGADARAPTAVVACDWPERFEDGDAVCRSIAASLEGGGARLTEAAAGKAQRAIAAVTRELRAARERALPRISAARRTGARRAEQAHATAATRLRELSAAAPWDGDLRAAAAATKLVATDLGRIATAAPKYDRAADRTARAALTRHDLALRRALGAIVERGAVPELGAQVPRVWPLDATALRPRPQPERAAVVSAPAPVYVAPAPESTGGGSTAPRGGTSSGGSSRGGGGSAGGGGGGESVVVPPSATE